MKKTRNRSETKSVQSTTFHRVLYPPQRLWRETEVETNTFRTTLLVGIGNACELVVPRVSRTIPGGDLEGA